jgi:hypothetical protein
MATNRWQIGALYQPGGPNGIFSQPGGIGTAVYPTQQNSQPWLDWPVVGLIINEYVPWWSPGCGHSIKTWKVIREWDYETSMSVALVCCEVCTYVQSKVEPFEEWLNPIQYAILIA